MEKTQVERLLIINHRTMEIQKTIQSLKDINRALDSITYRGLYLMALLHPNRPLSDYNPQTGEMRKPEEMKYLTLGDRITLWPALVAIGLPILFLTHDPSRVSLIVRQWTGIDGEEAFLKHLKNY